MEKIDVALRAFNHFAHGWATGDFGPYIEILAGEMEFAFPEGEHAGIYRGKEGRRRMIAKCMGHAAAGERLILHSPHHIMSNHQTVMLEFVAEGVLHGESYRGGIAVAFDIIGETVTGFREYYGGC